MKVELSKEEYRCLLEALEISNWVLFATKETDPPGRKKYRTLGQKIYSYAKHFGCGELIECDEETKRLHPALELEQTESVQEAIEEFEDDSFWEELLYRFVERDLVRREGEENVEKMDIDERIAKEAPIEEVYAAEFSEHGLDHLVIDSSWERI